LSLKIALETLCGNPYHPQNFPQKAQKRRIRQEIEIHVFVLRIAFGKSVCKKATNEVSPAFYEPSESHLLRQEQETGRMTNIRHSSSQYYARRHPMIEKITKRIGILPFLVVVLLVMPTGWQGAQQPLSSDQVYEQLWVLQHISADNAERALTQLLPPDVAKRVLIDVKPERNAINLVGREQVVQFVGQKLREIDKPGMAMPYLNTAPTPPPLSLNAPNQDPSHFATSHEENRNAGQNSPSATNITFRDPTQNPNFAPHGNPGYNAQEGYEPGTYFCKPSHLATMGRELQTRYGHDRTIALDIVQDSGKILVWAPQSIQREITALMTQNNAWAEVPAGRDPREMDGSLIRVTAQVRPVETSQQLLVKRTHTPKYATLDQIEAKLKGLFGKRLTDFSQPDEKLKKLRIAIPRTNNGMIVCDLVLDYPNYQLDIGAPQNIAEEMLRLLQSIDQPVPEAGYDRQFIAIPNSDPEQIRQLLEICRSKVIHDSSRRSRSNPNMLAYQRDGDPNQQAMRQVNYTAQDDGGLSGLRTGIGPGGGMPDGIVLPPETPMKIQVLPDLDVVIVDASPEEVRRIMDLIAELERLSEYAKSEIVIMPLKYVQCEALDNLLRTEIRRSALPPYESIYLYNEMFNTKQGRAWVIPLRNPNAMLIVGWGQARDAMKALIEQLDQPVQEETSILRVIKLEHVPVTELSSTLTTFFTPPPPTGPGMASAAFYPQVRWLSDPRTNTLIVQAGLNDYQDILRIVEEIDVPQGGPKLQIKTFTMKNLLATDMVTALNNALDFAMNGITDNRLPVVEIILESDLGKQAIESGFLDEVNITAVNANNTLVVAARGKCMPFIEELIKMLDLSPGTAMVKVVPIKNSDATIIRSTVESIFPVQSLTGQGGVALPGAEGGETFIPVRLAVDTRSNSILIAGAEMDIAFVETLINKLDREDALQRKVKTHQLRNSSARDVAVSLNQLIDARRTIQDMDIVSPYQKLQDAVIVVAEMVSNSLIISASEDYMAEIDEMLKILDQEPPQVMIQVLIAEVTFGKADEFGIELGLQDPYLFTRSTVAQGGRFNFNDPKVGLGNSDSAESLATAGTVATQMLSNFGTGRVNSDTNFGGLIFSASSDAVSVLIRAMQERSRVEILSRPQITAQDNQFAMIFVGQTILRAADSYSYQGTTTAGTKDEDVGLFVGVVPRISKGVKPGDPDKIDMLISASNSSTTGNSTTAAINKTRVETIVSALDGETVLLGGMLRTDKQDICRRVPFLSNIPIAGNLFKYEYEKQKRTELILIMRPRVVRKNEDMSAIMRVEAARMNWTLADVKKLHGDIGVYNPMARQPVTGGAPSFAPDPVDMSQLRDLPMPQRINNDTYLPPSNNPTNTLPNTPTNTLPGTSFEPTAPQPSTLQPPTLQPSTGFVSPAYPQMNQRSMTTPSY